MNKLCCKRIYETPAETDGFRILVDRLWPRGIKKEKADINYGQRKSLHRTNFENGFLMILKNMMSLKNFTQMN